MALTRLRLSCHHLEIEVGRYHKPTSTPVPLQLCQGCQMVEDEIHLCVSKILDIMSGTIFNGSCLSSTFPVAQHKWQVPNMHKCSHPTCTAFVYKSFRNNTSIDKGSRGGLFVMQLYTNAIYYIWESCQRARAKPSPPFAFASVVLWPGNEATLSSDEVHR